MNPAENLSTPSLDQLRQTAFDVLTQAVAALTARGKVGTAAAVRSEMNALTVGGFSLAELQYVNFRAFLEAAAAAGRVALARPAAGESADYVVSSPDVVPQTLPPKDRSADDEPLPGSVWRAFVSWELDLRRVVRTASGEVFLFPNEPRDLEPDEVSAVRAEVQSGPAGAFVDIQPASFEEQLAWATAFVEELGDGTDQVVLKAALANAKPMKAFAATVRGLEIYDRWTLFRLRKVRTFIEAWSARTGVTIDMSRTGGRRTRVRSAPVEAEAIRPVAHDRRQHQGSRTRLLRALESMTLDELLELRIPARLLLEADER